MPPELHSLLKAVFLVALALLLLALWFRRGRDPVTPKRRIHRVFFAALAVVFLGVYAYQGTWQLAGFARPQFVDFMKKYNRRPDSPTKRMVRGEIRDRNGVVLAHDDPDFPGRRVYPLGAATCHVVGYLDPKYGMTGIEAADHPYLEGWSTGTREEQARFGRNLLQSQAPRGNDLDLTLDARLQAEALRLLGAQRGAAIVIDPRTGEILVLASAPAFNPHKLSPDLFGGDPDRSPLLNRAVQGLYPAGSTYKMLVAAAALDRGLEPVLDCPAGGYVAAPNTPPIRDHEFYAAQRGGRAWGGYGRIGLGRALAKSSNTYFAQLGVQLGPESMSEHARRFLFNESVVLFEGSSGAVRARVGKFPDLRASQRAAAAQLAIGQGDMLATPLGMALATAAVANDGRMMKPRLAARTEPELIAGCGSPTAMRRLRTLLRGVVTEGTGRRADLPGLDVAGKTGTAQTPRGEDHAWFVCMAPAAKPRLVVVVLIEHGGYGSTAALPVAAGLLKKAQELGYF
ncbi:MAG TPA: penicillin-binding transpeptidase domain-containing protein [Kiritimatiellia bacterium]|nr:penicillin-binding transpeptidase domain-containing protein [Kiritimatiellia bacterium]